MNKSTHCILAILIILSGITATIRSEWVWVDGRKEWKDDTVSIIEDVVDTELYYTDRPFHHHHRRRRFRYIQPDHDERTIKKGHRRKH